MLEVNVSEETKTIIMNTSCEQLTPLKAEKFAHALRNHPNMIYKNLITNTIKNGANLGFEGDWFTAIDHVNRPSALGDMSVVLGQIYKRNCKQQNCRSFQK
jgi:hypothetical protein